MRKKRRRRKKRKEDEEEEEEEVAEDDEEAEEKEEKEEEKNGEAGYRGGGQGEAEEEGEEEEEKYLSIEAESHRLVPQCHEEVSAVHLVLQVSDHSVDWDRGRQVSVVPTVARRGWDSSTHPGQCLHSPRLCLGPADSSSSSAAEGPAPQTEPQSPATAGGTNKNQHGPIGNQCRTTWEPPHLVPVCRTSWFLSRG